MTSEQHEFSPGVEELLQRLASIDHLEVLLLMAAEPSREWSPQDVAGKLFGDTQLTGRLLADLADAGLAATSSGVKGSVSTYRYQPRNHVLRMATDELREVYGRHPFEVMRAITRHPPRSVQALADAFRFRPPRRSHDR